jgi:hypothetical protein
MGRWREDAGFVLGDGKLVGASRKAIKVEMVWDELIGKVLWIPRSVLHEDSEVYILDEQDFGDQGTVVVMRWWAEKQPWWRGEWE